MKVLLVASSLSISGTDHLLRLPNIGLPSIAACLDEGDYDVHILDLQLATRKSKIVFKKYLKELLPDIIGFTSMTFQFDEILEFAKIAKTFNPEIYTILGGYHATTNYEEILSKQDTNYFDFIVRGEGEITFPSLLDAIKKNGDYERIPGISYKEKNGTIRNNPLPKLCDLGKIPLPRRKARIFQDGYHIFGKKADVIETSRGCIHDCKYCSILKMYGRSFRIFNINRVIEDIKSVRENGIRSILIVDDNITLFPARLKRLCERLEAEGLNEIDFSVQAEISSLLKSNYLVSIMAKAGFKNILLSVDPPRRFVNGTFHHRKFYTEGDVTSLVSMMKDNGMLVVGAFVEGYPEDDKNSLWADFEMAIRIGFDITSFLALTPFPGTKIREELLELGLITNTNNYSAYTTLIGNVRTYYITAEELTTTIKKMNAKFLLASGSIFRLLMKFPMYLLRRMFYEILFNWDNFILRFSLSK